MTEVPNKIVHSEAVFSCCSVYADSKNLRATCWQRQNGRGQLSSKKWRGGTSRFGWTTIWRCCSTRESFVVLEHCGDCVGSRRLFGTVAHYARIYPCLGRNTGPRRVIKCLIPPSEASY